MPQVRLADIAFTRAGDKGDISDVTVFALDRHVYDAIVEQVTPQRVKECYGGLVTGAVTRYTVPNVLAVKFVLEGALGGGGPSSLRADNLGKAMGGPILRLTIDADDFVLARVREQGRPPRSPYDGAGWVVH